MLLTSSSIVKARARLAEIIQDTPFVPFNAGIHEHTLALRPEEKDLNIEDDLGGSASRGIWSGLVFYFNGEAVLFAACPIIAEDPEQAKNYFIDAILSDIPDEDVIHAAEKLGFATAQPRPRIK